MKSNTDKKYDINNELVLRFQQGDDNAFTELFNLNQGLINLVLNKYNYIKIISNDTLESACYLGFIKASTYFRPEKEANYSTYCIKIMEREIFSEIAIMSRKDRDKLIKNSQSMNDIIERDGHCTEKIIIMNLQEDDKYFIGQNPIIKEAIEFALDSTQFKYKNYLPHIANGEYLSTEIADKNGISRQLMHYHVKQFLKNIKRYLNDMNINRMEEIM